MSKGNRYTHEQLETAAKIAMVVTKIPEDKQWQFLMIAEAILTGVQLAQMPPTASTSPGA